jgi:hypothetical protein
MDHLDKFYTIPSISLKCIEKFEKEYKRLNDFDVVIEPSVGSGSFYKQISVKNKIGIDISPDFVDENIITMDFLKYEINELYKGKKILVIGNPPFGRVSSMAIKFFNHASSFCNVIAFIIPKTFRKVSVQNKLNPHFHLVYDMDIPDKPCSFTPAMNAKCAFQIWERRNELREVVIFEKTHPHWDFLSFGPKDSNGQPTPPLGQNGADFAIRAYGGKCGYIVRNPEELAQLRPKSWHWIKSHIDIDLLISRFEELDYSNSQNTARQNSIGRGELVSLYIGLLDAEL